jgi:CO/xanthine dehydrogenase FAD-binding subunit
MMAELTYHRPKTLREALEIGAGAQSARFIAGGTELMLQLRRGGAPPPQELISLRGVEELLRIEAGTRLRIGASVPLTEVAAHPVVVAEFPALATAIESLGSRQIRNVATVGGNLCNASPCADTAPPLLIYRASVELHGATGKRELPLEEFFRGVGVTSLGEGEILTAILLDPPAPDTRSIYLRKGRVEMDLAMASVAALIRMEGSRCVEAILSAGAVAPVPLRLTVTEAVLAGAELDEACLRAAREAAIAEITPITDLRASAGYRRQLVGVFVERALRCLLDSPETGA